MILDEFIFTVQVLWEEPFTVEGFPITSYTVDIFNETSELFTSMELSPDVMFLDVDLNLASCTNLTFSVTASNSVGMSTPGIIQGDEVFPPSNFRLLAVLSYSS